MESTATRLARLRAQIDAGTYAPPTDAVAEALVGWIASPSQFERAPRGDDDHGDHDAGDGGDEEGRR
jgi:hypothetical protein